MPQMSDACKEFVRWTVKGSMRPAFQLLSQLPDKELFRALAIPAREDIGTLFTTEPEDPIGFAPEIPGMGALPMSPSQRAILGAAGMGGKVLERMSEMNFAHQVVKQGKTKPRGSSSPSKTSLTWATDYVHHCVSRQETPLELDQDLTGKLPAPMAGPPTLTEDDFKNTATALGVDVPALKAVAQVESAGAGFSAGGRPVIRYELHRFHDKTHKAFDKSHPHLSRPSLADGSRYHNGLQDREYSMLFSAMLLNKKGTLMVDQAIESTSWGKFQVMGEHWSSLGWSSAVDFASDMFKSEANHLKAFVKYVQVNSLTGALKRHEWGIFAAGYNGPNFAVNHYDTNMEKAFRRLQHAQAGAAHP